MQNQQNVAEIILHFCSIKTIHFLSLPNCLLTVLQCHRSSTADADWEKWPLKFCQ